jgi:four helix bundle protein
MTPRTEGPPAKYDRNSAPDGDWRVSEGPENEKHPFDLEERTARFGEAIVGFSKKIPRNPANDRLIGQLVGCGTSVGGNYCEADERVSRKDFRNVIGRCAKEAKETKFFLRMVAASELASPMKRVSSSVRQGSFISSSQAFTGNNSNETIGALFVWDLEIGFSLVLGFW